MSILYTWYPHDFDFRFLKEAILHLLSFFTDIWGAMCQPFIKERYHVSSNEGYRYLRYWSYLSVPIIIFCAFIAIVLVKKIIILFIERGN